MKGLKTKIHYFIRVIGLGAQMTLIRINAVYSTDFTGL